MVPYCLFKPSRPQHTRLRALEDNFYEVEATSQINKRRTHLKVKCMGYDSLENQWIKISV